jgi:uncharacterized protein YgiM (DUF1202 family)
MTHALIVVSLLVLVGCGAKPPAPPATAPGASSTAPAATPPAAPAPAPVPPPAPAPAPPPQASPAPAPAPAPPPAPPQAAPAPALAPPPAAPPAVAAAPTPVPRTVTVKANRVNLRAGPGTTMKILRVLPQGTRLAVLEERGEWLQVRLDSGQEGWVATSVTAPTP